MSKLSGSVGRGGANAKQDVILVQQRLNAHLRPPMQVLDVDGLVGSRTIAAIEEFQGRVVKMNKPDGRVDAGGKTWQALLATPVPQTVTPALVVAIHAWVGQHTTNGFRLCAETAADNAKSGEKIIRHTPSKTEFLKLFTELQSKGNVREMHIFSHSGMDGPIFNDGQFMQDAMIQGALPKLSWAPDAKTYLHGCNSGLSPWAVLFANQQQVVVHGAAGFTLFSQKPQAYHPFSGDPDKKPCYLDCFPGMVEIIRKKYGLTAANSFTTMYRHLASLPEWIAARTKHHPPKPMIVFNPDGTKQ